MAFTDGALRLIDPTGNIIEDGISAHRFTEQFGEAVENYSYTKFVYYKPLGYPQGSYRVGPLARLNIVKSMGTPRADQEFAEFKQLAKGPIESSFYYHHARLVEALYGIESMAIEKMDQVDAAIKAMIEFDGPYLLEVRIPKEEDVYPMIPAGGTVKDTIHGK